ncbi:hypothetical protein, partial [Flavobacterium foetidum]|uniref:hypothetical protein n=1 Tax=Flavobacterium foetidum TaxID=2026681 RepID=UPI001ABF5F3F
TIVIFLHADFADLNRFFYCQMIFKDCGFCLWSFLERFLSRRNDTIWCSFQLAPALAGGFEDNLKGFSQMSKFG